MSRTNKTRFIKWICAYVDQMKLSVIVNKDGMKINVCANVKN